ncbi:MAG: hypothetical protein ACD_62C00286G0005 [uncultured bacterium]|nr:MAG: hypothetical protein ACD_62C00286G0005 [uncultured bacterium]
MDEKHLQQIKSLKDKFRSLSPKKREAVSVCFLKTKLGVHTPGEFKQVQDFLGDCNVEMVPENLDKMINYLHSESHSLPEFIALEDSLNNIDLERRATQQFTLPRYNPDDVETLTEDVQPGKIKIKK